MREMEKKELLQQRVEHVDVTAFDARPVIEGFRNTAFQARNLASACEIYSEMLGRDNELNRL